MERVDPITVEVLRRFNRTVTQRVGALEDGFLARGRPLGQARVLWEIGEAAELSELRARLDLDSGYLSRLLRALETDGLVTVEQRGADGRERTAVLTAAGRRERAVLDQRADDLAIAILTPLSQTQRQRLVAAMGEVQTLLVASMLEVAPRSPSDPAVRRCVRSYFRELARRFADGFDPARSLPTSDEEFTPPAGVMLLATLHGEAVGCAGLRLHDDEPAEIKRMWVAPEVRGLGLGARLLDELEMWARAANVRTLHLETNRSLTEAIAMYRRSGFREVSAFNDEQYADHWFEKHLRPAPHSTGRG